MTIKVSKKLPIILGVVILVLFTALMVGIIKVNAAPAEPAQKTVQTVAQKETDEELLGEPVAEETNIINLEDTTTGPKALAAAIAVGLAAAAGAIAMGIAIAKSAEGISRQPEAEGSIRTTLMLGLVFIETAIIYALIVAILIIFVM